MKEKDELKEQAKLFREIADLYDKLIVIAEREENGEDVKEESENLLGQLMVKFMKIQGTI